MTNKALKLSVRHGVRRALRSSPLVLVAGLAAAPLESALADPFPPVMSLASLLPAHGGDGSTGFIISGFASDGLTGSSVSPAGDVNGDGVDDVIIGSQTVGSYVVFGRDTSVVGNFPPVLLLESLVQGDGSLGFALRETRLMGQAGWVVSGARDVNGDGIADLIIGAPFTDPQGQFDAGASYVLFGRATGFPAIFALESLLPPAGGDGSEGFVITGIGINDFESLGTSVSAAGDVNGDGIGDLVVGAPGWKYGAGAAYVVFGRDSLQGNGFPALLRVASLFPRKGGDGSAGFVLQGYPYDGIGRTVSGAGDLNGDGIDDLLVGAFGASPLGRTNAGQIYAIFGRDSLLGAGFPAVFPLVSLLPGGGGDGSEGFVMPGVAAYDFTGLNSVSDAGDLNGDGLDDLIIGVPYGDSGGQLDHGESFVVFGRAEADGGFPAVVPLLHLFPPVGDGHEGVVLTGSDGFPGASVSAAGDLNDDGIDDVVIGSPLSDVIAGRTYVVFGRNTAQSGDFPAVFPLVSLLPGGGGDGSTGFALAGIDSEDASGASVSAAGDVNADGIGDLIIGAPQVSRRVRYIGETYIVFGRSAASTP